MPVQISGWIEFSPYENSDHRKEDSSWISWMELGSVIEFNDEINWILIGNPKDFYNDDPKFKPIAKERGFPKNPDVHLKTDINNIIAFEKKHGKDEIFGFSYFYFSEVENINWNEKYKITSKNSDWIKLFELIKMFKEIKSLNSDQIRITTWYNY
ncbi:hypothetical protein [Psychroserpens algicola]|uniref:Uncharacterized protein n=1 Tax=Psychroserpens algicola TaxID=1719034 RepID=A0ABT0HEN0_9FLAO|nr:hypothetical protein [Psychroserpens algicola]MCK8482320.1 hypothetical protein [Psychroserpens algicola]